MTTISKNWNLDENYWILNPMIKAVKAFNNFYEKDKSKKKEESSKLMWAIAMLIDPSDYNIYRNLNQQDRAKLIAEDFLGDVKFNWDHPEIKELTDTYTQFCITVAERQLYNYESKMAEREAFINTTKYSLDSYDEHGKALKGTADKLDKMMVNTDKIFARLEDIKETISKEATTGSMKGGATESASESGEL